MVERIVVGPIQTNCFIYSADQEECAVIDPGADARAIMAKLDSYGIIPAYVLLTHGHFDHIAGLAELLALCAATYPRKPRVLVHRMDKSYLGRSASSRHAKDLAYLGLPADPALEQLLASIPRPDDVLEEGAEIPRLGLTVIETPGHTRGSVCLYQKSRAVLFAGDTLFAQGVGRTDLPGGSQKSLVTSITTKLFTLPGDTKVYPGHGPFTTIEREQTTNPFVTRAG